MSIDNKLLDKIEKVSEQLCISFKRLPFDLLIAHCAEVFDKVNIPRVNPIPEEYFEAVLMGIINYYYDGCEPEFETEKDYNRYEAAIAKLKQAEWLLEETKTDDYGRTYKVLPYSPYMDKTIPFLGYRRKK